LEKFKEGRRKAVKEEEELQRAKYLEKLKSSSKLLITN
jgi:hypothetical protein